MLIFTGVVVLTRCLRPRLWRMSMVGSGTKPRRGGLSLLFHQPLIGWCQRIEHRRSEAVEDDPVDDGGGQRGNALAS